jgi:hypothetical protein
MRTVPVLCRLLCVVCVLLPAALPAADAPLQLLRGLNSLELAVYGITPEMAAEGLREADIVNDTERRLRGSRVSVRAARTQPLAGAGFANPVLAITPVCRRGGGGRHFCHVDVELREQLAPVRDPGQRFIGATWRAGWTGEINRYDDLRSQIGSMVDQFAQDLAAAF